MKFSELREANLSKAQIKKVHDKADDLPKNDFIKRYGKEGDSVRFATATKMVKKELALKITKKVLKVMHKEELPLQVVTKRKVKRKTKQSKAMTL